MRLQRRDVRATVGKMLGPPGEGRMCPVYSAVTADVLEGTPVAAAESIQRAEQGVGVRCVGGLEHGRADGGARPGRLGWAMRSVPVAAHVTQNPCEWQP